MSDAVAALKAYRAGLLKRGKILQAAVVARCIALIQAHGQTQ